MNADAPMQNPHGAHLAREINAAFDDPAPDVPAAQVFTTLERQFLADKAVGTSVQAVAQLSRDNEL